jgi:hypothetical protein
VDTEAADSPEKPGIQAALDIQMAKHNLADIEGIPEVGILVDKLQGRLADIAARSLSGSHLDNLGDSLADTPDKQGPVVGKPGCSFAVARFHWQMGTVPELVLVALADFDLAAADRE